MYIVDNNVRKRLKYPVQCFVYYMNDLAKSLFMLRTHYANPHGLSNKYNVSTAED
jgi:D-alanyl-D-alanine carboxypeptidase